MTMKRDGCNLEVRACRPEELPNVIEQLDQEFVFGKQRTLSLSTRFPPALSAANVEQIRVAVSDEVICGALATKEFDWVVGREQCAWRGAMVGMVWVDSQFRGIGIGSNLLLSVTRLLHEIRADFGVLWTGIPTFYERAGWFLGDSDLFGEAIDRPASAHIDAVVCRPLVSMEATWLEHLRVAQLPMYVIRNALDYCAVPIPASHVLCFCIQKGDGNEGFALVGEQDGTGYFYEMVAPPILWGSLWSAVRQHFDRLFVNGHSGDGFAEWLAKNRFVAWRPQKRSMWLRISGRSEGQCFDAWHIPYFDRI